MCACMCVCVCACVWCGVVWCVCACVCVCLFFLASPSPAASGSSGWDQKKTPTLAPGLEAYEPKCLNHSAKWAANVKIGVLRLVNHYGYIRATNVRQWTAMIDSKLSMVQAVSCQWYRLWAANGTDCELPVVYAVSCQWYMQWAANGTCSELPMIQAVSQWLMQRAANGQDSRQSMVPSLLTHLAPDRPSPPALFPYRETPDCPVAAS